MSDFRRHWGCYLTYAVALWAGVSFIGVGNESAAFWAFVAMLWTAFQHGASRDFYEMVEIAKRAIALTTQQPEERGR